MSNRAAVALVLTLDSDGRVIDLVRPDPSATWFDNNGPLNPWWSDDDTTVSLGGNLHYTSTGEAIALDPPLLRFGLDASGRKREYPVTSTTGWPPPVVRWSPDRTIAVVGDPFTGSPETIMVTADAVLRAPERGWPLSGGRLLVATADDLVIADATGRALGRSPVPDGMWDAVDLGDGTVLLSALVPGLAEAALHLVRAP